MEQGQGRLLPATWRRNFTCFIPKLPSRVFLTDYNAESLDALLDITYLVGTMLKVHPLAAWHSHGELFGRSWSHGVFPSQLQMSWWSPFSPIICRFLGTSSFVEAHFHQVCILSNVDKRTWDEVQEAECLCLDKLVIKCFSSFVPRAWFLKVARLPWEIIPCLLLFLMKP